MPEIKAILFDVGNVLLRLKTQQLLRNIEAAAPGLKGETMLAELREEGSPHHAYERGEISGEDFHAYLVGRYKLAWSYAEWLGHWNDYFLPNRPMEILIAKLQGKVDFWALSNTNREHFDHFRREYRLFDAFKGVIGSHEAGLRKPDPRLYALALEKTGHAAGSVFFIDDLEANVAAARALGMPAFLYRFNDLELKAELRSRGLEIPEWENRPSPFAC